MRERWMPVCGYEDRYMVSDAGRCANIRTRGGQRRWRVLSIEPSTSGYVRYALCGADGKRRDLSAHRLMWEAFKGQIPNDLQMNHKNGIKHDNRFENLEIVTASENTVHAHKVLGYTPVGNKQAAGSKNGRAKLTEADVQLIRESYSKGITQDALAKKFGVHQTIVSMVVRRVTWRHI